ncbi:MAG: MFS transporter [Anaerolineae bacterium]
MQTPLTPAPARFAFLNGITRNVWVLGAVSLLTDISSEMIVPVRILFLVGVLNTPLPIAGLIEGVAESFSSLVKIFSGRLADRVSERKPLILAGYTLSNGIKPFLSLVTAWPPALALIITDRIGKGIRTSPRDAVIADSTDRAYRGKAFGLHRAMDTLGAAIGPLCTFAILALSNDDLRPVFAWTAVPGVLSIVVLILFLREKRRAPAPAATTAAPSVLPRVTGALGAPFWLFTAIATLFALGNSSDAFIFLRTEGLEHSLEAVPLVYFGYNIVYALLATPLGALSDRWGRLPVLAAGFGAFGAVYAGWAFANQSWQAPALFLLYGIYAAATEGVGKALVTDLTPKARRGAAMGWFNGLTGFAALPSNILGGWLWQTFGPTATFAMGAFLGLLCAALLIIFRARLKPAPAILTAG